MNETRTPSSGRGTAAIITILAATTLAGCTGFGVGGTGERVIPEARLNTVARLDLPIAEASTQPATMPTSRPDMFADMESMPITIERARALALEHNLTLQVALIDPTIAAQNLTAEQARF
ncbi:MAG: hypothetical protein AAGD32_03310, partial [Planctomycetota bacterium]